MKIANDKYYTPIDTATLCKRIAAEVIGLEHITEVIEPSVGSGSFLPNCFTVDFGYDIEPECESTENTKIIKADFLTYPLKYKEGRLIIGNPPYGRCMNLAQKFYKKSVEIADYIAFILPISQLNNTNSLYEFDLVYSKDLGIQNYSKHTLHCCFNIYRRPINGLNTKKAKRLNDVLIVRQDNKNYANQEYDLRMCYWGNGCAGKILTDDEHYAAEYKIKVLNENYKDDVIRVLSTTDWKEYLNCIASRKIQQSHIVDVLTKSISGIK